MQNIDPVRLDSTPGYLSKNNSHFASCQETLTKPLLNSKFDIPPQQNYSFQNNENSVNLNKTCLEKTSRSYCLKLKQLFYVITNCSMKYLSNSAEDTLITAPEEVKLMRLDLKFHFMNPFEKMRYSKRRKIPWKLIFQLIQLIMVTIQMWAFSNSKFSVTSFLFQNSDSFNEYFIRYYSARNTNAVYTVPQLQKTLAFAVERYYQIQSMSLGPYDYSFFNSSVPPIVLSIFKYKYGIIFSYNQSYNFDTEKEEITIPIYNRSDILSQINRYVNPQNLDSFIKTSLFFNLSSVYLKAWPSPDCVIFMIRIEFDHSDHDGRVPIIINHDYDTKSCKNLRNTTENFVEINLLNLYGVFDSLVIVSCSITSILCLRSLIRTIFKAIRVRKFFIKHYFRKLSIGQIWPLFNIWIIGLIIGNCFSILGSLWKIFIEHKVFEAKQFDWCSIFLGLGVLFVWCSMLRFFSYFEKYNILLLTLRLALPNVIRFIICILIVYFASCLVGWVVLGPYHSKFRTLVITSQCLFSLLNGDDMYNTFEELRSQSYQIQIFCQIYLYLFISLFIYVVLSLFISLISETYETLKHGGHIFSYSLLEQFVYCNSEDCIYIEEKTGMLRNSIGGMNNSFSANINNLTNEYYVDIKNKSSVTNSYYPFRNSTHFDSNCNFK